MDPLTIATLISGAASVGSNIYSQWKTNQTNKALAEMGYDRERQNIQEQNEYNSPANQMSRYIAAGLNPNLIYGQISSGNQSGIAKYQAPSLKAPEVKLENALNLMSNYLSVKDKAQEIRNKKAQNQIAYAQLDNIEQDKWSKVIDNNWKMYLMGYPREFGYGLYLGNHLGTQPEYNAFDWFASSPRGRLYNAQVSGQFLHNDLNELLKQVRGIDIDTKGYILDNVLPERVRFLENQNKFYPQTQTLRNALLELDRKYYHLYRGIGSATGVGGQLIRMLK